MMRRSRFAAAAAFLLLAPATIAGPVAAQIPGDVSPEMIQEAISQPISVNPGETVSVDVGVPVAVGYQENGWNVSANGSVVTVTAPDRPGETITVPVSAAGHQASVTLSTTAEITGPADAANPANPATPPAEQGGAGAQNEQAPGDKAQPESAPSTPERQAAAEVETTNAEFVDLTGVIDGNVLSAKLSLAQATNLYRQFKSVDQESVKLRYVDVNNQIIKDVTRDVDRGSLSMTLTYPEGQTPDNPFIMELVRGEEAILIVRITSKETAVATPTDTQNVPEEFSRPAEQPAEEPSDFGFVPILAGMIGIVLIVALIALVVRASRRRQASRLDA